MFSSNPAKSPMSMEAIRRWGRVEAHRTLLKEGKNQSIMEGDQ